MSVKTKIEFVTRKGSALSLVCGLLLFGFLLRFGSVANGQTAQGEGQPATASTANAALNPVLVELFTSEGCSSCPPVDRLVQKWDTYQPIPGAQLIILSEHVTYWDHDGWKDPNSLASVTERQSDYEKALGEDSPATPQVIVDGTHDLHVNNPQELKTVLQQAAAEPKLPVRISGLGADSGNPALLRAHIEADTNSDKHNADVYVAVALDHVESEVLKGENGGKHLVHVAVVQELTKIGKLPKGKSFSQDVELKLKPGTDPKNVRVIAFVQEPGPGKLLGAAVRKPSI